jgi:3-methylcrotonyl-CoA carboxylase beta subunit
MNLEFNKNEDNLKQSLSEMLRRLEKIYEGGGKKPLRNNMLLIN